MTTPLTTLTASTAAGALTAGTARGGTLTAAAATAALTAGTSVFATLTASTAPGAAAGLLDEAGNPVLGEDGSFILLENGS